MLKYWYVGSTCQHLIFFAVKTGNTFDGGKCSLSKQRHGAILIDFPETYFFRGNHGSQGSILISPAQARCCTAWRQKWQNVGVGVTGEYIEWQGKSWGGGMLEIVLDRNTRYITIDETNRSRGKLDNEMDVALLFKPALFAAVKPCNNIKML